MSAELSGYVLTLSGRVDAIEQVQSYVDQQLLLRPDLVAFSQYQVAWNTQMEELSDLILLTRQNIATLQNMLINLTIEQTNTQTSLSTYITMLTGHIPRFATGVSASTHTG